MVIHVTGNGLRDWLIQRVSAIVIAAYLLFLLGWMFFAAPLEYIAWQQLFANNWMRIISAIVLLSLVLHAWIGMVRIIADYITVTYLRIAFQVLVALALVGFFIWGIEILWGNR